jgi:hypothetical protein
LFDKKRLKPSRAASIAWKYRSIGLELSRRFKT